MCSTLHIERALQRYRAIGSDFCDRKIADRHRTHDRQRMNDSPGSRSVIVKRTDRELCKKEKKELYENYENYARWWA